MFFLCSKPAPSSCGLWIGPKHISSCIQGTGLFSSTIFSFSVCPVSPSKQHRVHVAVTKVPVRLSSCTACHDVSFSWNEWSNYTNHNHPLKPIKMLLSLPDLWLGFHFLLRIPCSIGPHPCQQHSWQLPVSELCVWCFCRAEAVSSYRRVLMGTWRSMSHGSINMSNNWEPLHNAMV